LVMLLKFANVILFGVELSVERLDLEVQDSPTDRVPP